MSCYTVNRLIKTKYLSESGKYFRKKKAESLGIEDLDNVPDLRSLRPDRPKASKETIEKMRKNKVVFEGEDSPRAVLKKKEVLEIRRLRKVYSYTYKKLADMFGVSDNCILKICNRATWRNI